MQPMRATQHTHIHPRMNAHHPSTNKPEGDGGSQRTFFSLLIAKTNRGTKKEYMRGQAVLERGEWQRCISPISVVLKHLSETACIGPGDLIAPLTDNAAAPPYLSASSHVLLFRAQNTCNNDICHRADADSAAARTIRSGCGAMLTDGDATTEVALPQAWRTFEHLKAQLTGPSYARQGAPTELLDGASQAPSATLVLYSFFSRHSAKRRRGDAVASAREEIPAANDYTRRRTQRRATEGAVSAGCTPALRRAVHKALEIARTSMGSVETDVNSGAVLVLHVQFKPMKAARSAVKRRNKRPSPAWYISGLCVSECIPRVYRAATSATPLYPSAAEVPHEQGSGAAAASSRTNAGCEQATHIGDVWCSGTTFCGIKLFWVSAESRGCGLAYALIEAARRSVCYGYEVPAAHVAFSEPTWLGSRFAARYHQRDDFLVY